MDDDVAAASTPPFPSTLISHHHQPGESVDLLSVDTTSSLVPLHDDGAAAAAPTAAAAAARPHKPKFKAAGHAPPPLNSYALSAQTFSERRILGPSTVDKLSPEVHRGIALAALQRFLGPSRASARAAAAAAAAAADSGLPLDVANAAPSHTSVPLAMHNFATLSRGFTDTATIATASVMDASADDPPLFGATLLPSASAYRYTPSHSLGTDRATNGPSLGPRELPWWKRILVDPAYRQRVMQLSTEGYREEMRLLRDTPELLSSSAAKEVRKVWRERTWWTDELEKAQLKPSMVAGADASATPVAPAMEKEPVTAPAAAHGAGGGGAASLPRSVHAPPPHRRRARKGAPMMDEVDEVVVMAQHVAFRLHDDDVTMHFSTKHPRSVIEASAIESVTRVALGAMPPVQHVREQQRQEQVVKQHLASLRRFSASTSYGLKQRLARDVLAGRAEVPMQTAITEAVLDDADDGPHAAGGSHHPHNAARHRDKYVFAPRRPASRGVNATTATATAVAKARAARERRQHSCSELEAEIAPPDTPPPPLEGWHAPLQRRPRPPTPLWQRRHLPPGVWPVDAAHTATARAEALLHSSAVRDPVALLKRDAKAAAAAAASAADAAVAEKRLSRDAGIVAARSESHENAEIRRREAAAACVDGTENLYGLQYVWRLPLPPGGFLRVAPDPRYAMWPDSDDDDAAAAGKEAMAGGGAAASRRGYGGAGATVGAMSGAPVTSQQLHRQAHMRRLARRVNARTQKLRWLHRFGHRRVCYNDLPLSDSDSDAAHGDSSTDSGDDDDEGGGDGAGSGGGSNSVTPRGGGRGNKYGLSNQAGRRALVAVLPNLLERSRSVAATRRRELQNQVRRRQRQEAELRSMARGSRPVCEGALHINIYADVVPRAPRSLALNGELGGLLAQQQQQQQQSSSASTSTRRFLGCYRQSRLLVHYKLYCRALYEEARVRCGGRGTHVMGRVGQAAPTYTPAVDGALAGVPVIPFPVLRLQTHAPSLRKPVSRRNPVSSTIGECRCWEGLYPTPSADLAAPVQQAWRKLRKSVLVRQALRDIFDGLAHDKEGLLDKRTFVLFVLQLLQLFFPTHLPAAVHIAIAEEEWTYRGTTEHVGAQTFHEKFFIFPLIFHRDIAAVTEEQLVEFWTLVRVCFDAQWRQQEGGAAAAALSGAAAPPGANTQRSYSFGSANRSARPSVASSTSAPRRSCWGVSQASAVSILMPLTGFTALQLDTLVSSPPPPFDAEVYDHFCMLRQAFRENPLVRATPRDHQYVVARNVVEQQLRLEHRRLAAAALADTAALAEAGTTPEPQETLAEHRARLGSADAARRADVEAAAVREWEARQRRQEAQEHDALLEQSDYYVARIGRLQSRTATVLSGIESTCSTWDLHRTDVYAVPHEDDGADPRRRRRAEEEDVEEQLLEYLEDVPLDVFDGEVSLRERYLLHVGFQQERRHHALPWLQQRPDTTRPETAVGASAEDGARRSGTLTSTTAAAAAAATALGGARPTPPTSAARKMPARRGFNIEDEAQRYLAVMKGNLGATQRRNVLFAQDQILLGNGGDDFTRLDEAARDTAMTRSFAAGLYPLRAVPRTSSAVLSPSVAAARRGGGGSEAGSTEEGHEYPLVDATRRGKRRSSTRGNASVASFTMKGGSTTRSTPGRGSAARLTQRKSLAATYAGHNAGRVNRGGGGPGGVEVRLGSTMKAGGGRGVVANRSFYRKPGATPTATGSPLAAAPAPAAVHAARHPLAQARSPSPGLLSASVSMPETPTSGQVHRPGQLSILGSRETSMQAGSRGVAVLRPLPGSDSVTPLKATLASQATSVNFLDASEASSSVAGVVPSVTWASQTLTTTTSRSSSARGNTAVGGGGGGGRGLRRQQRPTSPTSAAGEPLGPAHINASRFASRLRALQRRQERYRTQFSHPVKLGRGKW